jgi:hypothetical protein
MHRHAKMRLPCAHIYPPCRRLALLSLRLFTSFDPSPRTLSLDNPLHALLSLLAGCSLSHLLDFRASPMGLPPPPARVPASLAPGCHV